MKSYFLFLGILFSLVSCTTQSAIELPPLSLSTAPAIPCETVYPQGKWQFVHAITFSMADGKRGTAIGVSVLDVPVIKCALLTVEGFVLFEAALDGELEITRAVPPFDNPEFARGLMRDLQLIFFKPASNKIQYGTRTDGSPLCRYLKATGENTDVVLVANQGWEINYYDSNRRRTRAIKAWPPMPPDPENQWLPPNQLELQANGTLQYSLKMNLISSEKF